MISERKPFWIFFLWMLFLPLLDQFVANAEGNKDAVLASAQDFEIADAQENASTTTEKAEGGESSPAKMSALSAEPIELLGKVTGLLKSKKYKSVVRTLKPHEDVVRTDKELLKAYVEALIFAKKPNWRTIYSFARILASKDRKSSLANFAQGLYYLNKRKPDTSKALMYLGKAKSAKKPFPGVSTKYYLVLLKKYWQILLILVAVPILVVSKIIKKKKTASKIDVDSNLDEAEKDSEKQQIDEDGKTAESTKLAEKPTEEPDNDKATVKPKVNSNNKATADSKVTEAIKAATNESKKVKPATVSQKKTQDKVPSGVEPGIKPSIKTASVPAQTSPEITAENISVASSEQQTIQNKVAPQQAANVASPQQSPTPMPQVGNVDFPATPNSMPQQSFDAASVRKLSEPERKEPVLDSPELNATWNRLCQKALNKRIPQQFNNTKPINKQVNIVTANVPNKMDNLGEPVASKIDLDVSIDLSEESLKDDLVGKLKMLAISDSELRTLFAQKKKSHIPHIIEYVLTRPEPLRLSFVARELGHYNDPAIIDTLASLLYHNDQRVVLGALQGLENTREPEAILHMCPFLKSETPILAQAARNAFANLGAVKILKAFINLPTISDNKIKEAGIFVLSRMKGKQVVELLSAMIDDDSLEIRKKVILAMSYQKNPEYIDCLRNFFKVAKDEDKALARKAIVYLQGFVGKKK